MPNRERQRTTPTRGSLSTAAVVLLVVAVITVGLHRAGASSEPRPAPTSGATSAPAVPPAAPSRPSAAAVARAALTRLVSAHRPGSISVAVTDLRTGAGFATGARSGMVVASVAKLQILETLLLHNGAEPSEAGGGCAVPMIEQSDNNAGDACFAAFGGPAVYAAAGRTLGLTRATTFTQGYIWGIGTSSASDQVRLLRNLVQTPSPLTAAARRYALGLLRSVESDQRWGVPVIADRGTQFAVKNGWLNIDSDGGLWAVNSDAIVRYHGSELAMSVLTQHNPDEPTGIALVEKLARLVAAAVTDR